MNNYLYLAILLAALTLGSAEAQTNKNGVSPDVISLPSGPGSIEGLGEAFQPNINNGTGKQSVGIQVPPGTAGHAPSISLVYEGGDGNGKLGMGWQLPLAYVQRQSDKGIPRYVDVANGLDEDQDAQVDEADELDGFINEMREELVPVTDGDHVSYFCENEGAFIRYRKVAGHWEGRLPNGTRLVFGESTSARISDPDQAGKDFCWLLESSIDRNGNEIRYRYRSFEGPTNVAQKYLEAIEYGAGAAPWGGKFHFVAFTYEDRTDWFEDCRCGFPMRTGKRLSQIYVGTQGVTLAEHLSGDFNEDSVADSLNRTYKIAYKGQVKMSLVESITLFGADGVTALPSTTYDYTVCLEASEIDVSNDVIYSTNEPAVVFDDSRVDFIDLNGDGLPDLLRTSDSHRVYYNAGEGIDAEGNPTIRWTDARDVEPGAGPSPWALSLSDPNVAPADMDGDGLSDICQTTPTDVIYFKNDPDGAAESNWGSRVVMDSTDIMPPSPLHPSRLARMLDVDFNKRIDVIQSSGSNGTASYRIWYNLGGDRYSRRVSVTPDTGYDLSVPEVKTADMNGDRLRDFAWIRPGEVRFTISLGNGRYLSEESMPIPEITLTSEQLAKTNLRDVNGDGLDDLVVVRPVPQEIWYWPNRGNRSLGDRIRLTGVPAAFSSSSIRWADINGNGTTDIIVVESGAPAGERMRAIDLGRLTGCEPRPNLLNKVSNGLGRVEEIEYTASTEYIVDDGTDETGNYSYSWPDVLPFPITVIKAVRTSDSLGDTYETRYRYHDGYYDSEEKQFRGFARVEVEEVGDATAPTLISRSYFDTGKTEEALKGKAVRRTTEDESGGVFSDVATAWTVRQLNQGAGGDARVIYYTYAQSTTTDVLEQGRGLPRQTYVEYDYDNYGNQTSERNYGIVEGGNLGVFDDERITHTSYAYNLEDWLVSYPFQIEVSDLAGTVINRTRNYYDDEAFSGGNGGVVTKGNLTLVRQWKDIANDAFIKASRTRYDVYGNPTHLYDPLYEADGNGHWREIIFDPDFHAYAERETIHVDGQVPTLSVNVRYDRGFGKVIRSEDFNDNATTYKYDVLARATSIVQPYDSEAFPTKQFSYHLAQPFGTEGLINWVETRARESAGGGQFITREFVDGLGRTRMTKHEDEDAGQFVVKGVQTFNARRSPHQVFNPYTSPSFDYEPIPQAIEAVETQVDALVRTVRVTNQDGTFSRSTYEPFVVYQFDENDTDQASKHFETPMVKHKDGLGRLIREDDLVKLTDTGEESGSLATWSTVHRYRVDDKLLTITDSQGNVKAKSFDNLGRLILIDDPDRGFVHREFDDASNITQTTDHKGQVISYTFDGANRTLTEDYLDEGSATSRNHVYNPSDPVGLGNRPDVAYFYDTPINGLDLGNGVSGTATNLRGQLAYVWDLAGEEHFSYDARGRVDWQVKRLPDLLLPGDLESWKTHYTYDSLDRMTRLTYPDTDYFSYNYNARGLLESIPGGPSGHIISSMTYKPWDSFSECVYGNGVSTSFEYDPRLRMRHLSTAKQGAESKLIDYNYTFDGVSNISRIDDLRALSDLNDEMQRRNTQLFHYDNLYRLTKVAYPEILDGNEGKIDYRYDRLGNMLSKTSTIPHTENGMSITNLGSMSYGGPDGRSGRGNRSDSAAGPHALTSLAADGGRSFDYDRNGNMTQIDGMQCSWDFEDRLATAMNGDADAQYTYDYSDRRVTKKVQKPGADDEITHYINRYFEIRPGEPPVKYVWNGETRVARITGSVQSDERTERLQLRQGWNLVAVGVEGAVSQLLPENSPLIDAALSWQANTESWTLVDAAPIEVPTGVWVRAAFDGALFLNGVRSASPNLTLTEGATYVIANGSGSDFPLSEFPADADIWTFDSETQAWKVRFGGAVSTASDTLSSNLVSGSSVIIKARGSALVSMTRSSSLDVRYYHQDHQGSTNVITDSEGILVEEAVSYPFGAFRHRFQPGGLEEAYGYTQKEKDQETGLNYFEARYQASHLGRFISVDPSLEKGGSNVYAYTENNPVTFIDPDGLEPGLPKWAKKGLGEINKGIGIVADKAAKVLGAKPNGVTSILAVPLLILNTADAYEKGGTSEAVIEGGKGTSGLVIAVGVARFAVVNGMRLAGPLGFAASIAVSELADPIGTVIGEGAAMEYTKYAKYGRMRSNRHMDLKTNQRRREKKYADTMKYRESEEYRRKLDRHTTEENKRQQSFAPSNDD